MAKQKSTKVKTKAKVQKLTPPKMKAGTALVKALKPQPQFKKDGSPWTPWADEVALRLAKREERRIANGGTEDREGKCIAHTSGVHGPKRLCDKAAIRGLDVCGTHGGSTKMAKEAAKRRLTDELDPTINRMIEIRDQSDHMPSALGASIHILNRVLGKPDAVDKDKGAGRATINIGIAIGGIPAKKVELQAHNDVEGEVLTVGD